MFEMGPETGIIEIFIMDSMIDVGKPGFSSKQIQPVSRKFLPF